MRYCQLRIPPRQLNPAHFTKIPLEITPQKTGKSKLLGTIPNKLVACFRYLMTTGVTVVDRKTLTVGESAEEGYSRPFGKKNRKSNSTYGKLDGREG